MSYQFHTNISEPLSEVISRMEQRQTKQVLIRKRLAYSDNQTQRFQCFCSKQYLSYTALYCHVKTKHNDFFQRHRQLTKYLVDIQDPIVGYITRKLIYDINVQYQIEKDREINKGAFQYEQNPTSIQSTEKKLNSGVLLDRDEQAKLFELNQIQKLKQRLQQSKECKKIQERKLKIYSQKMLKLGEMITNLKQVTDSYQNILKIINIPSVRRAFENPNERQSEQDQYAPE